MKIVTELRKLYHTEFFNNNHDPYYVLVSCIMSLRTKDEVTFPLAKALFKKVKTPEQMLQLSEEQLQKLIYPVGFYKRKAKTILTISKILIKQYNSKVPNNLEQLLEIPGVGRKTANIVLAHGYKIPALPVDTHVHRISNRLGLVKTNTPEQTEEALKKVLPKKYWIEINELLVKHGQNICKPISPWCTKCSINNYCKKINVNKFR
jgi:endonuclease III